MASIWVTVDGRKRRLTGPFQDLVDHCRSLRADGHEVKQAKAPSRGALIGAPRGYATASSHIRRG